MNRTRPDRLPAGITGFTATLTLDAGLVAPRLSVTVSEKINVVATATDGAVNVGCDTVLLESVTAAPETWVQA